MGEVDIARQAVVTGQVGVIENVVVEAVAREDVAAIVGAVERPVVAQPLRAEHKDAVVPQLVVLDDRQRLEGFAEPDTVGDDATAEPLELVDGADDPVALELEQSLPDFRVANPGRRVDDLLFVELAALGSEQVVQDQRVNAGRSAVRGKAAQRRYKIQPRGVIFRQPGPLRIEPRSQPVAFFVRFGSLNQIERVARREAEPVGAEGKRAEQGLLRAAVAVAQHDRPLWDRSVRFAHLGRLFDPGRTTAGEPAALQAVAGGPVRVGSEKIDLGIVGRQD